MCISYVSGRTCVSARSAEVATKKIGTHCRGHYKPFENKWNYFEIIKKSWNYFGIVVKGTTFQ